MQNFGKDYNNNYKFGELTSNKKISDKIDRLF